MNLEKIGKFIANCRKEQNLTQEQLAEKLGLTFKAISKWECGKGLPDVSIMLDLCRILKINIVDLLSGEKTNTNYYIHKTEGSMVKKMTIHNSLRKFKNDDICNYNISKISDINNKKNNVTFKVILNGFDIIETESYATITLEVSDDTGEMSATLVSSINEEIRRIINDLEIGKYYLIKGFITLNEEVKGGKLLIIDAIKSVTEGELYEKI